MQWLFVINVILIIITLAVALGIGGLLVYAYLIRAETLINRWIDFNSYQYQLIQRERRWLRKGPFILSFPWNVAYRVEFLDKQGQKHVGWVLCGDGFLGAFNDELIFTKYNNILQWIKTQRWK